MHLLLTFGWFPLLAVMMNNAAVNICVQAIVLTDTFVALSIYLEMELLSHVIAVCLAVICGAFLFC